MRYPLSTRPNARRRLPAQALPVLSLFSGVGAIELGLSGHGFKATMFCEALTEARHVLATHFPDVTLHPDVRLLASGSRSRLPECFLLAAGFPCQDLSQCGLTKGIEGRNSGLIGCVFELLTRRSMSPDWLLLENVPFMLRLNGGEAMRRVTDSLEGLGFRWAYRVIDARAFGLPQRRERVILLASRKHFPEDVLFGHSETPTAPACESDDRPRGFYWTEGNRGLGWAVDSIPTLKAGSTVGIPSPPAIWLPAHDAIVTPTIEDAEAFQGLPRGWTSPASILGTTGRCRWRLVGNAVPVPIADWVGGQLVNPPGTMANSTRRLKSKDPWPLAAFGTNGSRFAVAATTWPDRKAWKGLAARFGPTGDQLLSRPSLSRRATAGFYNRIKGSSLRTDPRFIPSLSRILKTCSDA